MQVAAKAQRASVEAAEVFRYEVYNAKHGAKYIDPSDEDAIDTNDWGTPWMPMTEVSNMMNTLI